MSSCHLPNSPSWFFHISNWMTDIGSSVSLLSLYSVETFCFSYVIWCMQEGKMCSSASGVTTSAPSCPWYETQFVLLPETFSMEFLTRLPRSYTWVDIVGLSLCPLSIRLFANTAHSFASSALLALLACPTAFICSLTRSRACWGVNDQNQVRKRESLNHSGFASQLTPSQSYHPTNIPTYFMEP